MQTVFHIFLRDLKRILTNPVAIVITLGVCIIPSLYAWTNILANWDPYENTATVPIAVVITDEGADVPGMGEMNAGAMVRDRLKENHQLGWTFVDDEETAKYDLSAGKYYAAFIIPRDFTQRLAGVLEGTPEPAHIDYLVNEKLNAVAPKVTDTGATTLENEIASQFVSVAGGAVTEKLKGAVNTAADEADDARGTVEQSLTQSASLLRDLAGTLDKTSDTIGASRTAVAAARETTGELAGTASNLKTTLSGALDDLGQTRSAVQSTAGSLAAALGNGSAAIARISSTAAYDIGELAGDAGAAQGQVDRALAELRGTLTTLENLLQALKNARDDVKAAGAGTQGGLGEKLDASIAQLDTFINTLKGELDRLQGISDNLKESADSVRDLSTTVSDAIGTATSELAGLQSSLLTDTAPALASGLDAFADAGGDVAGAAETVSALLSQANGTLEVLDGMLDEASGAVGTTSETVESAADDMDRLAAELAALGSVRDADAVADILKLDPATVGTYASSPVKMADEAVFPVANYGSGVAPFYTNLALWVGGFVLVAIYKLEVDPEGIGVIAPWQSFLGRWLLLAALGQVQALICCIGDIVLGIQCVAPAAFVFAGMVASAVYVLFVYALAVAFKHIGKALAVLIVVLQIPGASGLYPIQMQPGFFRALGPLLPFTYGINAMREAVAGFYDGYYLKNLAMLLVFIIPSAIIGIGIRRYLLSVNTLFDRRLAATDLMVAEREAAGAATARPIVLARALLSSPDRRSAVLARTRRFRTSYPTLVRRGLVALVAVPLALLGLLFILPAKFALLMCWIVSLVALSTYLIVIEYLKDRADAVVAVADSERTHALGAHARKGGDAR
ncbi:YhgE/Pip domain-containing protein [Collinsella sp. An307]|uniref:YhgE/Pip domain-containing protein n=1 Tax=Collinsella sp. An307 TaxID=1965630 RepID=UPI000B38770F|nr:YhgE/Pip domain-containing protein [Collinsella sp. An307]OUO21754.1 hypothetical protein B5F89_02615 [Collinsella sp. An307]